MRHGRGLPGTRPPRARRGPRPLDRLRSLRTKLGVLVAVTVTAAAFLTWAGLQAQLGPSRTFPLAIVGALVVTQVLARGMTSPLREMTAAARAMAHGDYSRRVRATSRDEVGQLADAFNSMAEDLASVDAMRREIVANVSHELRTPVTALRAQLENMVDGITPTAPDHLRAALTQTERLGELVGYLLDLSRIEAGAVGLDLADVVVRDLLDEVVAQVRGATSASGREVRWAVEVVPGDLHLRADRTRLAQVLANLLHNAARHTPPGTTVTVRAGHSVLRQEVVVDVADQGEGIPEADRERIFERFQRGSAGPADGAGGTGLGLAIARWAVALHGGTLTVVEPAGGEGATMRVRLPVRGPRRQG